MTESGGMSSDADQGAPGTDFKHMDRSTHLTELVILPTPNQSRALGQTLGFQIVSCRPNIELEQAMAVIPAIDQSPAQGSR